MENDDFYREQLEMHERNDANQVHFFRLRKFGKSLYFVKVFDEHGKGFQFYRFEKNGQLVKPKQIPQDALKISINDIITDLGLTQDELSAKIMTVRPSSVSFIQEETYSKSRNALN